MTEMYSKITANEQLVLYTDIFPKQKKILRSFAQMTLQPKETLTYWLLGATRK